MKLVAALKERREIDKLKTCVKGPKTGYNWLLSWAQLLQRVKISSKPHRRQTKTGNPRNNSVGNLVPIGRRTSFGIAPEAIGTAEQADRQA
eukprot:4409964-Pyramimonas_sp.AAC.1